MDGVIIDSEPFHRDAYFKHFEELGIEVSPEEYSTFVGLSTENSYQYLINKHSLNQSAEELSSRKREIFYEIFDQKDIYLISGVETLIHQLKENNFQLILASSSVRSTINKVFTRFNLYPYFSHIVSGEDFEESKPDPAIFIRAVELSGNLTDECIIIEDSTNGILAAKGAGVYCIAYDQNSNIKTNNNNFKKQDLNLADKIITDFSELSPQIIKEIKN